MGDISFGIWGIVFISFLIVLDIIYLDIMNPILVIVLVMFISKLCLGIKERIEK